MSEYVCDSCGAPSEPAIGPQFPGHTTYAPCSACGAVGIRRVVDQWQSPQIKKPNVKPYHESPYRGGKLRA